MFINNLNKYKANLAKKMHLSIFTVPLLFVDVCINNLYFVIFWLKKSFLITSLNHNSKKSQHYKIHLYVIIKRQNPSFLLLQRSLYYVCWPA